MMCTQCQTANPDGSQFCESCGAQLASVCPACGKEVRPTARFCRWCGGRLAPATSGVAPTEQGTAASSAATAPLLTPALLPTAAGAPTPAPANAESPSSFVNGRYTVKRFLGEGGRKVVYLAYDTLLDRDVAFSLIKTEGLDPTGMVRIQREAQAMGRLGNHPHIVSIFDIGEESGQVYIVSQLMGGGDIEGLLEKSEGNRLTLDHAVRLADQVCQGLEHAHRHGIIHRDLKPGNVWLTAEGTAKLGDFGLAVALDRSRLTGSGMMVGTAGYMPPEQALQSEVDARADLYSFGAMLYEMIVGRPPFQGADSFAVITQHLNTPPTPPSHLQPDVPPDLDRLVLHLLAKDRQDRPSSATEVRLALRALDLTAPRPAATENRTAAVAAPGFPTGAFVGRQRELEHLQAAFDQAAAGKGALVAVVGEAGIGKSTLCGQLARYVEAHGGSVLGGRCYDDAALARPYAPFIEALGAHVRNLPVDEARRQLAGNAGLARLMPDVAERLGVTPPADASDDSAWRLVEAATSYLHDAALVQPLLLVLDDLHQADRASVDLLAQLVRSLARVRILVVGTYREDDLARDHPLTNALAALRRTEGFQRIALHGFNVGEAQDLLRGLLGPSVGRSVTQAAYRQTEGNPLFLQQLARYLADTGVIVQESATGRWRVAGTKALAQSVPQGLRDVIERRLARLSTQSNQVLARAAVIGEHFDLAALQRIVDMSEDESLPLIEEAVRAGVLAEVPSAVGVQYRFAHALFRAVLYQGLNAPRRLRLHQQVAQLLESRYGTRLDEHAAELAEHFVQSSDPHDQAKAVAYGRMGAERALAARRYGDAVQLLELVLPAQELSAPEDQAARCDLLLALGEAQCRAGFSGRAATETAPLALALARSLQDDQRASRACRIALEHWHQFGMMPLVATAEQQQWAQEALASSGGETADRVRADLTRAQLLAAAGQWSASGELIVLALRLAERLEDPESLAQATWQALAAESAALGPDGRQQLARRAATLPAHGITASTLANLFWVGGAELLVTGDRPEAERRWEELATLAEHSADPQAETLALAQEQVIALLAGDLAGAIEVGDRLVEHSREVDYDLAGRQLALQLGLRPLLLLGRENQALLEIDGLAALEGGHNSPDLVPLRALTLAHAGRLAEAQTLLDSCLAADPFAAGGRAVPTALLTLLLETAVLLDDPDAARVLTPLLTDAAVLFSSGAGFTCIARCLGAAAVLLGDLEAARTYYNRALREAARLDFRPEVALTQLELAGLMLQQQPHHGDGTGPDVRDKALAFLDRAIDEFRAMDMQPALRRALRHKGLLKA